ncbi:MAG: hypothetical protein V3S46_09460 [Nitrospinota bacterium]
MKRVKKPHEVCFTKSFCVPEVEAVSLISLIPFTALFLAPILYYTIFR